MGIHGHHRIVCKECEKIISTCRCMSKDKTTIYETCDACKIVALHQKEEESNAG